MALNEGILLDTHAVVWLQEGTLSARADGWERIQQAANNGLWFVCSFALQEMAHAVTRNRLSLDPDSLSWFRRAVAFPGPKLLELTPEIAATTIELPSTFQGDPGDRIIAATAIVHRLTVCTHDDLLLKFGRRGLFPVIKVNKRNHHAG